jgi:hypothetical protein
MKKRNRLILLIFCAVLFFLIAPLVIFYSQGYRFDFDEKKFVGTGGVYIEVSNTLAEIYLDGKFIRKTGLFSNTALIKNLLPKKHSIEIKKEGFWSWQKTLEIEEKKVTKIEDVLLIKKDISFKPLVAEDIEDFLVSQDGKKILLKKITEEENWSLEELSLENGVKREILAEENLVELTKLPAEITVLEWDSLKNRALIRISFGEKISYFLLDYNSQTRASAKGEDERSSSTTPILSNLNFLGEKVENVSFNPKNNNELFYLKDQMMFKTNLQNREDTGQAFLNNLVTFKTTKDDIIWLSTSGFLFKTDYSGQTKEVLNRKPFFVQEGKKYKIEIQNSELFLLESKKTSSSFPPALSLRESLVDSDLYYLSLKGELEKIMEGVREIKFSTDSKKAVYWNDYEIWILEFGPEKYKEIFLTRFSKKIGDCFWLTPYYLIFNVEKEVKITEIDNRDKLNIVNLRTEEENNPKIFYNEFNKKLYIFNQEKLFSSEPVIP